ncbi:MAG: hypothetical protein QOE83_2253 [Actinomycetota bacterium]|jgi:aminoglycoside phosphotransferase (APT) family kinase protein|nr:hypothetical protein [Actinomycetota bacterium]
MLLNEYVDEQRLPGGNASGASRVGNTVRRKAGPWTPAVHSLLRHLASKGFSGSPRPLGIDDKGREILTFLEGATVGEQKPWPEWTHAEATLDQVAGWLRSFHEAVADFKPPTSALWRFGQPWAPGLIVGHGDAAPYNAVWRTDSLVGFIDWDFASPVSPEWDLAFVAFSWVPLHTEAVVKAEGFLHPASRPERLRRFLRRYGWEGDASDFMAVVRARARADAESIRTLARSGDSVFVHMLEQGVAANLDAAANELSEFAL